MTERGRVKIGEVGSLFRYPVKSMGGERIREAELGWHGLEGDRRLALRRVDDRDGFPWLTATKLPDLIRFTPVRNAGSAGTVPTHVRTPEGEELALFGPELADEIGRRSGQTLEMTHLNRGIFDEASISAIAAATVAAVGDFAGLAPDARRFRPNILISSPDGRPFAEDEWVGGTLTFGEGAAGAAVAVTNWDVRCPMINFDPDSGQATPELLRAVVRERDNKAGVYGTVVRRGRLAIGQPVYLRR